MESSANLYRVAVRAVPKRVLFQDGDDKTRFLNLLKSQFAGTVEVLAWCLTDRCVQMVLWGGSSALSHSLQQALAMYAREINKARGESGRLYQDRFFSEPLETDDQLLAAVCAVHLFPQTVGESTELKYGWSSYREYLGAPELCNTVPVLGAAGGRSAFRRMHRNTETPAAAHVPKARVHLSDEDAKAQVESVFGPNAHETAKQLPKPERNERLRALKAAGLSARQITQFTGIGRGVIEKL